MKVAEIGRLLFDELGARLSDSEFKGRWSHRDFVRKEEWGASRLHLFYYNYPNKLQVSGELIIRINEVQRILEPFLKDREPKFIKELPTLSTNIGFYLNYTWNEPILSNEHDIAAAVQELVRIVRDVAEPFYTKYHHVQEAYDLLNSERGHAYSFFVYMRGMTLLAMANILGRDDDLAKIAEEYRARIVKAKESNKLPQFEALLASLS